MKTPEFDVYVAYSAADASFARTLMDALRAGGLEIFDPGNLPAGENLRDVVVAAMAECRAVIAVVTPESAGSPSIAVELGAALAWMKPIFVLTSDAAASSQFAELAGFRVYDPSRVDDVIFEIKQSSAPLSDADRNTLIKLYATMGVPTDRLVSQPASVVELAEAFRRQRRKNISGERLVQELIRLRKQGRLSRTRPARSGRAARRPGSHHAGAIAAVRSDKRTSRR